MRTYFTPNGGKDNKDLTLSGTVQQTSILQKDMYGIRLEVSRIMMDIVRSL